jgi:dipeptidyl-peptidase 4
MSSSRVFLPLLCLLSFTSFSGRLSGAETNPSPALTLQSIFVSGTFGGDSFSGQWLEHGSGYTTWESSKDTPGGRDLVRHDPETGDKEILVRADHLMPPGEASPLRVDGHAWSRDMSKLLLFTNTKRVWRAHTRGDYWVLDRSSRELTQLGGEAPAATLMFATFSPDATRVAYVREHNLYVEDITTHGITALTTDGGPDRINGTFDWVYEEELSLRHGFRWSPDGGQLAYWQLDTTGVREFPLINHTDSLYPKVRWIKYPKVGEMNAAGRVGVVNSAGGETRWLKVPGHERQHYIHSLEWFDGFDGLVLQQLNRLQSTNRVFGASPDTGKVRELFLDRDDAWVEHRNELRWLRKSRQWLFLSDRGGWQHVYRVPAEGGKVRAVTKGSFDVRDVLHVDEAGEWLYFIASPESPAQRYLYRVRLSGRGLERLTPADQPGSHGYKVSPDGQWAVHTWSTFDQPPVTDLIRLASHERVRWLAENQKLREKIVALDLPPAEFFRVDIGDGVALDGLCLKPPGFDPQAKYPVLVYVYGEPAGQTVQDRWGGRNQLWHRMLAQEGCVVLSFDNRGTAAPRGRDFRKSVYRQVGILGPADQASALRATLAERPWLDTNRVGIWGWSGGGSSTLQALFKHPDLYHAGIAVASVPNQRYYDTIYQERYMGLPSDNVEGFERGSAINFAHQLKGRLLLVHGTGDDNVHYQGVEALINELVRHKKQFQVMPYPNRAHGISEGRNTTMHLYTLMTDFLRQHLIHPQPSPLPPP